MTSDRPPFISKKRRRYPQESYGPARKKAKSDNDIKQAEEVEEPERPQKQAPKIQSAIYASHRILPSFDIFHTIDLISIGM